LTRKFIWFIEKSRFKKKLSKTLKKDLPEAKKIISLPSAKASKFCNLLRVSQEKINFKKYFQKACPIKKNSYFCTRFETQARKKREDTFIDILN